MGLVDVSMDDYRNKLPFSHGSSALLGLLPMRKPCTYIPKAAEDSPEIQIPNYTPNLEGFRSIRSLLCTGSLAFLPYQKVYYENRVVLPCYFFHIHVYTKRKERK